MFSNNLFKIILASSSPRRLQIMQEHQFNVIAIPSHIEEVQHKNEDPKTYVTRLAKEKAQVIFSRIEKGTADIILAADTVVVYQNHILEKPSDDKDANRMLNMLSGHTHDVYTGYALLVLSEEYWWIDCISTKVTFNTLTRQQITHYIASRDPFDKAGAYGIQNVYKTFIKEIQGSYYNVMGLPIEEIIRKISSIYTDC